MILVGKLGLILAPGDDRISPEQVQFVGEMQSYPVVNGWQEGMDLYAVAELLFGKRVAKHVDILINDEVPSIKFRLPLFVHTDRLALQFIPESVQSMCRTLVRSQE